MTNYRFEEAIETDDGEEAAEYYPKPAGFHPVSGEFIA
jgi:hypothetical protein